jgi:SAM-dependent methyltransferase
MNSRDKEIGYWDFWNMKSRSGALDPTAEQVGEVISGEILSLNMPNPRFLEVGCGTGWMAERLVRRGGYLGLDLSPKAIEVAQKRVPGARFCIADFVTWDLKEERFDIVLFVDSIAYFADQSQVVSKAAQLLDHRGYLVLSTVNPFVYSRMSVVGPPAEGQVRKWLSRSALFDLLERGGFSLVRSYTVLPAGDRGILRVLNSRRLNLATQTLLPEIWIRRAKELCGLGQYRIAVARRR